MTKQGRVCRKSQKALEAEATERAFVKFRQGLSGNGSSHSGKNVATDRVGTSRLSDIARPKSNASVSHKSKSSNASVSRKSKRSSSRHSVVSRASIKDTPEVLEAKKARLILTQQTRRREENLKKLDFEVLQKEQQYRLELLPYVEQAEMKELDAGIYNPDGDGDDGSESELSVTDEQCTMADTAAWVRQQEQIQQEGSYTGPHGGPQNPVVREVNSHGQLNQSEFRNEQISVNVENLSRADILPHPRNFDETNRVRNVTLDRDARNVIGNDVLPNNVNNNTWIDDIPDGEITPSRDLAHLAFFNLSMNDFKLPTFTGDPAEWTEFTLAYKNRVHDNPCLTNSQRLGYLHKCLSGAALNKVYGLLWDGKYYGKAMRTLQSAYGNPCRVIEAQKQKLMKCAPVKNNSDIPSFCSAVGRLIQTFQTMNYRDDLRSLSLLSDLKDKLPNFMLESWGRYITKHGRHPDVLLFYQWLLEKEESLMLGGKVRSETSDNRTLSTLCESQDVMNSSLSCNTSKLDSDSSNRASKPLDSDSSNRTAKPVVSVSCQFCKQSHWIDKCDEFLKKGASARYSWFFDNRRCFICGRTGHRVDACKSRRMCQQCGRRHHTVLHDYYEQDPQGSKRAMVAVSLEGNDHQKVEYESKVSTPSDTQKTENEPVDSVQISHTVESKCATNGSSSLIPIIQVRLHSDDGSCLDTFALLDSGSQATLIREELADRMKIDGRSTSLTIGSVVKNESPVKSRIVTFSISNPHDLNTEHVRVRQAWTVPQLNLPGQKLPRDQHGQVIWSHIRDLDIPDIDPSEVGLLIGVDTGPVFKHLEVRESDDGPTAVRCPLGWHVMGMADDLTSSRDSVSVNHATVVDDLSSEKLCTMVERFWGMEEFGCKFDLTEPHSVEDRRAIEQLQQTMRKVNGHYEVGLLWKNDSVSLPYNRAVAMRRWLILENKLRKDEQLREEFQSIVKGYIEQGYASEMSDPDIRKITPRTYYIPQQAHKSTHKKLRVVNDCRQPCQGMSLNDALLSGPQLTSSLIGVLIRYRCGPVAVGSDVKAMFHQIFVSPSDRDSLRFLWKEDVTKEGPPQEYCMNVHIFGAKSSPCVASYALQQTGRDNVGKFLEEALKCMFRNFYVDDFLKSFPNESEAISVVREVKEIATSGGFQLAKWVSNSQAVLQSVSPSENQTESLDLAIDDEIVTRTLGVHWSVQRDEFFFRTELNIGSIKMTKRGLLSAISTIFDPLGFLLPYTLSLRLLLQTLWERKLDWDQELSDEECDLWKGWIQELTYLHDFSVSRCFWDKAQTPVRYSLHTFSDSSERAYAAVTYLQCLLSNGEYNCSIVLARARVAPLKSKCTIPRLELCGAVLATRVASSVQKELDLELDSMNFWSDSLIVIQSIRNESKRFPVFESNRYGEIHRVTTPSQWRHVPGHMNPADEASRGLSVTELSRDHRWVRGPSFLWGDESGWPEQNISTTDGDSSEQASVNSASLSDTITQPERMVKLECPIDCEKYEKLSKLLSVTAFCLRYINNLRACISKDFQKRTGALCASEVQEARLYLVKVSQHEYFFDEMLLVQNGKPVPNSSRLSQLTPVLENGVMRMRGRIDKSLLTYDAKHPFILHPDHPFSKLLVNHAHRTLHHFGPEYVISEIRKKYWISNLRTLAKQSIFKCLYCHRRRVEPCVPIMAQLPTGRVESKFPFSVTGLDYLGHYFIKIGRRREKRWIALFTCLTTRALHLELVSSLSTDAFIMALRRFIARRGQMKEIFCDNGTNFVGCDRELKEAVQRWNTDPQLSAYCALREITFHFNPPLSPHMGGAWERVVKSVKRALNATLQTYCLHEDTLRTTLCEIEATVNSRPLTTNSNDPNDPTALTPNHFLLNRFSPVTPPDVVYDSDEVSRKRWRQSQLHAQNFWTRFKNEYLPGLNITRKWKKHNPNLSVGDVVLMVDSDTPRGYWPLARITKVFPSEDGCVRKVEVKTKSGVYTRPASKLCLLEGSQSLQ